MLIALRMRLIANSPPNANPNRRAIRFSFIVSLRVNVSTQAEGIRSPKGGERGVRRRRKGFAYASSVSGWHNVIALAMVCCSPHANSGPGGGARGRAFPIFTTVQALLQR